MTHIPSVRETYAHLADTARQAGEKLAGYDLRLTITPEGVSIRIEASDGAANGDLVSWDALGEEPAILPLRIGMCAGELMTMRQDRDRRRAHDAAQARERREAWEAQP